MLTWIKRFLGDFLYDESAAQRYIAAALFAVGTLFVNGGAIPGTQVVVADLSSWSGWGAAMQWLAVFVSGGVKTPGGTAARELVSGTPPPAA